MENCPPPSTTARDISLTKTRPAKHKAFSLKSKTHDQTAKQPEKRCHSLNTSHYLVWRKPETYANSASLSFRLHLLRRAYATLSQPIKRGRPERGSFERDHPRIRESLIVYHQLSYHYLFCCSCTVSLDPKILQLPRNTISKNATKPNPNMSNQKSNLHPDYPTDSSSRTLP